MKRGIIRAEVYDVFPPTWRSSRGRTPYLYGIPLFVYVEQKR